jgi:hypothetical protein
MKTPEYKICIVSRDYERHAEAATLKEAEELFAKVVAIVGDNAAVGLFEDDLLIKEHVPKTIPL